MSDLTITITEEQRQGLLMALAHLAVERPGFHPAFLKPIAELMDDSNDSMYERFRELHSEARATSRVISAAQTRELIEAAQDTIDSADDEGCTDDLTVTSSEAVERLVEALKGLGLVPQP